MKNVKIIVASCLVLILIFSVGITSFAVEQSPVKENERLYEIEELREANSKTFQLADGSYQSVVYAEDIHYTGKDGKLKDIDNAITNRSLLKGYAYGNTANFWRTYFADSLSDDNAVVLEQDGNKISFNMPTAQSQSKVAKASALSKSASDFDEMLSSDNRAVVYRDILPNVDIAYTVRTGGVKEDIILRDSSAPNTFEMDIATNLSVVDSDGIVNFVDKQNKSVFFLAPMYMEDAGGKRSEKVEYQLEETDAGAKIVITADEGFLNAADTQYPVVIDPSVMVTGSSDTFDTCVDEQYPSSNYYLSENLWTGGKTPTNTMRTYIKFNLPTNIASANVTSVDLRIKKREFENPTIRAYRVTGNWTSSAVTWSSKPGFDSADYTGIISLDTGAWYKIDAMAMVKKWMNGTYNNYGFILKEPSESSTTKKTKYYSSDAPSPNKPELVINYTAPVTNYIITYYGNGNTSGSVPTSQTVAGGSSVTLRTNTGNLAKTDYTFVGWNTNASGTGTTYSAGQTISMPLNSISLYAKWTAMTTYGNYSIGTATTPYSNNMNTAMQNSNLEYNAMSTLDRLYLQGHLANTRMTAELLVAVGGGLFGYSDAANLMSYYLGNTGSTRTISFQRMNTEWAYATTFKTSSINEAVTAAKALSILGETRSFYRTSEKNHTSAPTFELHNWYLAIGSYSIYATGTVRKNSSTSYSITITYGIRDFYDWSKSTSSYMGIIQRDLWELHNAGIAKQFEVKGTETVVA